MTDEEKRCIEIKVPDFNQFYPILEGYIEFCIQKPKMKLMRKEKEGLEQKDIIAKEKNLKDVVKKRDEKSTYFQKQYDVMCEKISKNGIPYLKEYVEALKKLYADKYEWKRDIKTLLVQGKSLKLFKEARNSIEELYPVLVTVNNTFPIDDYVELSLSPKAAMYGIEVDKTQKKSTKREPMENEEYQTMLDLFQQKKDYKRLGEWLMAILAFMPDQVIDCFQKEYIPRRKVLKEWAYEQLNSNESYKRALIDRLFENQKLSALMDAFVAKPEMEKKIKQLHETNEQEKEQHEERRKKQFEIIQQKNAKITDLENRFKDFNKCCQQLSSYKKKYQAQVNINERITIENDRRIQEIETVLARKKSELKEVEEQFEKLHREHLALQSDYSLKINELQRFKEMVAQKEETARNDILRELVTGISDQFYYLMRFYLELKDTGKLEPESIELYENTLNNIDNVLASIGIKKIGILGQTVAYDSSIHDSTDAKLSNGDIVIVNEGYGWKIGDEVYIKAPVEKGVQ